MKATQLYQQLEKDFITPEMSDDWAKRVAPIADFVSENFKKRSMGLVCDFTSEINKVYTAIFPSKEVMQKILDEGTQEALLFIHHPAIWDIRQAPEVFQPMDRGLLEKFKQKKISIYNLHVPLDNYGEYSTGVTLAKALDIKPQKPFGPYFGALCGVFGQTDLTTVQKLRTKFQEAVGHAVSLYNYGDGKIAKGMVAVVAGGGLTETIAEIARNKVNVLVTGIAAKNEHSWEAHAFAEKNKINILGGTHYSTENFACQALVGYFKKMGLPAEFIKDEPVMEDM